MSTWIKTSDRLPNGYAPVLIACGGSWFISYLAPNKGFYMNKGGGYFISLDRVEYWMPIPELPKVPEDA